MTHVIKIDESLNGCEPIKMQDFPDIFPQIRYPKFLCLNNEDVSQWHLAVSVRSFDRPRLGDDLSRSTEVNQIFLIGQSTHGPSEGHFGPASPGLSRPYFRRVIFKFRARSCVNLIYRVYSFRKPSPDWLKRSTRFYY